MNIKRTTSKCVRKKIISTNKNKDEVRPSHMKVHPTRLSHNWRPNFAFENYYVPPSFEFLGVILHKQHEWIKLWHQKKKSNCFCQNGCLCQIWLLCQEWVWARSNVDLWNAIFKYMSWRLKSLGMNFGMKLLFKAKDLVTTNDEKNIPIPSLDFMHDIACKDAYYICLHIKLSIKACITCSNINKG